jgi:alpha-mannosidase
VVDATGRALPSAVRADTLRAVVVNVPPTGGRVVFVVPTAAGAGAGTEGGATRRAVPVGAEPAAKSVVLENDRLRVEIDRATGELARVVDLATGREVLQPGGGGNRLETREDRPLQWDAWNIDDTDDPWEPIADTVRVGEAGRDALGRFVEVTRADRHGRFVQRLTLPDGARRLEVETGALWRADHRLLKASFPLALSFDSVWAEIPYGAIARPAVARSKRDSARYELPMQRWIDASDGGWGVSVVNDAKHGYDVRGDTVRITLLKSAKWPDDAADMGLQVFRYDLVVHDGDWRSGATEEAATALDQPLRAVAVEAHAGEVRASAFASVEGDGVQLGALKVAEDDAGTLVLRLVERHGAPATATLELPWPFEWRSADLLERPDGEGTWTASEGKRAAIPLAPWEIGTVLVRRR